MTDSVWGGANRAACGVLGVAGRDHGMISTCAGESRRLYSGEHSSCPNKFFFH